jgi:hypothetical protein
MLLLAVGAGTAISGSTTWLTITPYPLRASVTDFRLIASGKHIQKKTLQFVCAKLDQKGPKQKYFGLVFEADAPSDLY